MADFTNPDLLGEEREFRKSVERPILAGREPDATDEERKKALAVQVQLSNLVNKFVIRRTNTILGDHLPPKLTLVVCCRLTPLQV